MPPAFSSSPPAGQSPRNWPITLIALLVTVFIVFVGAFFYARGKSIMEFQLKERLRSTAATAAMQFDPDTIDSIRGAKDADSTALRDTVDRLQRIREHVPNIRFAYIMRRSGNDTSILEFVADADLALSESQLDRNGNGMVDSDEEPAEPGDAYDAAAYPAMLYEAFLHPTVDRQVTTDQWGPIISGYAPIQRNGRTVAVLGIDMSAEEYVSLSQSIFSPFALLLIITGAITIGSTLLVFLSGRRLEAMQSIEQERNGLLRMAFHQLGEPLAIIKWSLELLKEEFEQKDGQSVLRNMEDGIFRLQEILYSLRDADLIHAGKMHYNPEIGSLNDIISAVADDMSRRMEPQGQTLTLKLEKDLKARLDKKLIASVIQELLTNAMHYSPKGSEITVRAWHQGREAIVEVQDNGHGIPPDDVPRLFNEFARGSNATLYKADGTGLGLYIVKGVIQRAGGDIKVRSRLGRGTVFSFTLPLA